jgi:hypothetical protein
MHYLDHNACYSFPILSVNKQHSPSGDKEGPHWYREWLWQSQMLCLTVTKYLMEGSFRKERGLFCSLFWRFKVQDDLISAEDIIVDGITLVEVNGEGRDHGAKKKARERRKPERPRG